MASQEQVVGAVAPLAAGAEGVWYGGHATVAVDMDGLRLLTDPLLGARVGPLARRHPVPAALRARPADAVLVSHLHHDHLDLPSLRWLGAERRIVAPRGAGAFLARRGFRAVTELAPGEAVEIGPLRVLATPANHAGRRAPFGPSAPCLGYVVEGRGRVYFAGDTDLFPGMAELGRIDVALLPVAGWGPRLGPGHMDPLRAARALRLIRPRWAVPIHWGTLAPLGLHLRRWSYLARPPGAFQAHARALAPTVDVRVLEPGGFLRLGPGSAGSAEPPSGGGTAG
jgi:L-ascorbate metabolism protein UlaG (beta-lactamase superfamily)